MSNDQDTRVAARTRLTSLRSYLESKGALEQVRKALPAGMTPERAVRQTMTLIQNNPGLLECTQVSILAGLIQTAELGLELSGPMGQAFLVPRHNRKKGGMEAVFQLGYRGLIDLAHRTGKVRFITARRFYAGEHFRVTYGTNPGIEHYPDLTSQHGRPIGYYAVAGYLNGGTDFEIMTYEQVVQHRDRYAAARGASSPWTTHFDEMADKTVLRKLAKRLPLSVDFQTGVSVDEWAEAGVGVRETEPALLGRSRTEEVAELLGVDSEAVAEDEPAQANQEEGRAKE